MGDSPIPGSLRAQSAPAPEIVVDYARTCVACVENAVGVRLDFSPETLPVLDHYLQQTRGAPSETASLVVAVAGCYLGEIVRLVYGFAWEASAEDPVQWRLRSRAGDLSIFPVAIAHVAVHGVRAERDLRLFELSNADRAVLKRHLDALPPVDEDQYVAPSTRIEVLELAWDIVKARHGNAHEPPEP
jgi:hypothetical protein